MFSYLIKILGTTNHSYKLRTTKYNESRYNPIQSHHLHSAHFRMDQIQQFSQNSNDEEIPLKEQQLERRDLYQLQGCKTFCDAQPETNHKSHLKSCLENDLSLYYSCDIEGMGIFKDYTTEQDKMQHKYKQILRLIYHDDMKKMIYWHRSRVDFINKMYDWLDIVRAIHRKPQPREEFKLLFATIFDEFEFSQKNTVLFFLYTTFFTKSFKNFHHNAPNTTDNILIVTATIKTINLNHVLNAIKIWKKLEIRYITLFDGFVELMRIRRILNPQWDEVVPEIHDLTFKFAMIKGLRFFFD